MEAANILNVKRRKALLETKGWTSKNDKLHHTKLHQAKQWHLLVSATGKIMSHRYMMQTTRSNSWKMVPTNTPWLQKGYMHLFRGKDYQQIVSTELKGSNRMEGKKNHDHQCSDMLIWNSTRTRVNNFFKGTDMLLLKSYIRFFMHPDILKTSIWRSIVLISGRC